MIIMHHKQQQEQDYWEKTGRFIKLLAEEKGFSQSKIASVLNELGILSPMGRKWKQPNVAAYMKLHNIQAAYTWPGDTEEGRSKRNPFLKGIGGRKHEINYLG